GPPGPLILIRTARVSRLMSAQDARVPEEARAPARRLTTCGAGVSICSKREHLLIAGRKPMKHRLGALAGALSLFAAAPCFAQSTTLTIATVNNGDMIRMQGLTSDFTAKNPDIGVKWVTLEENVLRQRVTTDIATKGGQFDVLTIGTYEVPIWAKQNWLVALDKLPAAYDVGDLLPKI